MWASRRGETPPPAGFGATPSPPTPSPPTPSPLVAVPAALPEPGAIPPRAWLYGTFLVRGFVSLLVAPGGVGKSSLALAQALALAIGQPLLGEHVHHSVPVWVLNLEDPLEELNRRLAALMLRHAIPRAAVAGRLFLHSGRTRPLRLAEDGPDGIAFPDRDELIAAARAVGVGALVVDPFVKTHRLDENANDAMDAAATAWAEVAEATGAAVLLVHHVRKGAATDVEAARGAKALTDAARAAHLLSPMSAEDAAELGIEPAERWRHVRLDDAKANLAPRAGRAAWYRLDTVRLGNASADYPNGDSVAAIIRFQPESVWKRLSPAQCHAVLDRLETGPEPGALYAAHRRGLGAARWAGRVVMELTGLGEAEAAQVIGTWLKNGLLIEVDYRDAAQRKLRQGVRVVAAKRPTGRRAADNF